MYKQISQSKAKQIMDENDNIIILDVRTKEEYLKGHIKKSILIPYDEIHYYAPLYLTDKTQTILVYCRTGRRSKIAAKALIMMGYENVYEFGGILEWPYKIVK